MRVGTICYATAQGIGHLPKQFFDAGVITDVKVFHHSSRTNHLEWYPEGTEVVARRPFDWPEMVAWLKGLDVLLQFETPFDWHVLPLCRRLGVRTAVVPMYECTPERFTPANPAHDKSCQPDKWICPSLLDQEYFPGSPFLEVPLDPRVRWRRRERADRWLHNAGHLGLRGHKGTLELLQAVRHVRSKEFRLTVRCQDGPGLEKVLRQVPSAREDRRVEFVVGDVPWEDLFKDHDAYVAPEKYNGLSLPLREAFASGMLVVTTKRFPHDAWLPNEPLVPVDHYTRERVSGNCNEYDEAHVDPATLASVIDAWVGRDVAEFSLRGADFGCENSWATLKGAWLKELSTWPGGDK